MFLGVAGLLLAYEIIQSFRLAPALTRLSWVPGSWVPVSYIVPTKSGQGENSTTRDSLSNRRTSELAAAYSSGFAQRKKLVDDNEYTGVGSLASSTSKSQTAFSWFEQAALAVSGVLSEAYIDTADAASSAFKEAARYASDMGISEGLVHLPRLVESATNATTASLEGGETATTTQNATAGAAWSSSSWASLTALPAYLKAVALHGAPRLTSEEALAQREEQGSIFSARRKGEWMGCTRAYHLVCKGVYRAIKRVNAVSVVDTACTANARWLPLVLEHLRKEFRVVQLTCADRDLSRLQYVKAAYSDVGNVKFMTMDPFKDKISNETDLVIGVKLLDKMSMINVMKFFKNIQSSAAVKHVVFENYPNSKNRVDLEKSKKAVRLNGYAPPFMFGKPVYQYQNADEQPTSEIVEILAMETSELFAYKETPHMADLEDPKLRKRRVEPV